MRAVEVCGWVTLLGMAAPGVCAQTSFATTVELALRNSPRVKLAQDDVQKATAAVAEVKDYYLPNLGVDGGLGKSFGITLTVPTIFTVNTQSLIYSPGQRDHLRQAKDNLRAAVLTRDDVRQQVEEDAAASWLALAEAQARQEVLAQEAEYAAHLEDITGQRNRAGLDSGLEIKRALRAALQIDVLRPEVDSDITTLTVHLNGLMGRPQSSALVLESDTAPSDDSFARLDLTPSVPHDTLATLSSEANAKAKAEQAQGDLRFAFRPQVLMQSQYGRISPINDVEAYYNLNGHYNVSEFGVAIQLPLFDRVRAARARETVAEAMHAHHQAEIDHLQQQEDAQKAAAAVARFGSRMKLAQLDLDIARDQLGAMLKEVQSATADFTGGRQMGPKDELYARIEERQRYYDWLEAQLQWRRANLSLLREQGTLQAWISLAAQGTPSLPASTLP